MRDEDHRQAQFLLEVREQVQDLCSHRHVECGGGLVCDDRIRADGQGSGDGHALALATRELSGKRVERARRQADERDQFAHTLSSRDLVADAVHAQRVSELILDAHTGVQGRRGVLEDHGDDATDLPAGGGATLRDLLAVEEHLSLRRHLQATHDVRGRGLATAGLADDAERLSALDAHVDATHRVDLVGLEQGAGTRGEGHLDVLQFDDRGFGCLDHRLGFNNQSFGAHRASS